MPDGIIGWRVMTNAVFINSLTIFNSAEQEPPGIKGVKG
jgi:hypothetical protein